MDEQYKQFMNTWGQKLVERLKQSLTQNPNGGGGYPYAPGFNGNAYSMGRNKAFGGVGDKIASGGLYNSISFQETSDGFALLMNSYWEYVNYGRKPGKYVPIAPLQQWAQQRLGLDAKEARGMAFGMSNNIEKFGIAPTDFFEGALALWEQDFTGPLNDEIGRSIDDFLQNILYENLN
jgi:hypothetical protein